MSVRLRDGRSFGAWPKNESAFDLQLLSVDGRLHLLSKNDIAEIVREKSLMPKVDEGEVRDLVAFLGSLRTAGTAEGELGTGVS